MLERLRTWWRYARAEGKVLPGGYLFPGLDPMDSLSTRQLNRAVHEAAHAALGLWPAGHRLESTVRYLGIEVDDALEMAEQTEV
jgi:hypothetical protein